MAGLTGVVFKKLHFCDTLTQFKNDVHVFSLKFNVAPGHTARLTPNKSDLTTGVWSRCCMGGGPPFPLGRAQHAAGVCLSVCLSACVYAFVCVYLCAQNIIMCNSCAASVSQDTIIVFGGVRNSCGVQEPLNDVWTYDLKRFQWRCVSACADDMHAPAGKVRHYRPPPMPFNRNSPDCRDFRI